MCVRVEQAVGYTARQIVTTDTRTVHVMSRWDTCTTWAARVFTATPYVRRHSGILDTYYCEVSICDVLHEVLHTASTVYRAVLIMT